MPNHNGASARRFHEATKLTYINLRNKPPLYKSYPNLSVIPLPSDELADGLALAAPALPSVAGELASGGGGLDLKGLARLLYHSCGVIRKAWLRTAGEVHYRAAASAGALYPTEAYVVCGPLDGLDAGVYHFAPESFGLRKLRDGDYRQHLAAAAGGDESVGAAPATVVFTTIFWRSSWKYRSRGYRYCHWDAGTVGANLLASAAASGLPGKVVAGFSDSVVDRLVGADGRNEASLFLVPLGAGNGTNPEPGKLSLAEIEGNESLVFADEVEYPDVRETHASTLLGSREEAAGWKGQVPSAVPKPEQRRLLLGSESPVDGNGMGLGMVITSRGSTRRYRREAIPADRFGAMLHHATRGVPSDFAGEDSPSLVDTYLIVNAVEGIPSGAYFYSPGEDELHLVREGNFREESGHLCFEQALSADASAVAFIMADLDRVTERFGNRGYRAAQLEAGILGGRLYLASYALGMGASGITFFDDEVVEFFSPHSDGKDVMFVVTLGLTAEENRVQPFRSRVAVKLDALARGAGQHQLSG